MKGIKGFQKGHKFYKYRHPKERGLKISVSKTGKKRPDMIKNNPMKRPEIVKKFIGKNHPRWVKDRTKLKRQDRRDNPLYAEWRLKVWKRDGFRCKINNKDCRGKIETHHILRWNSYPELRYEIDNGITLCHYHHPRKIKNENELIKYFQDLLKWVSY